MGPAWGKIDILPSARAAAVVGCAAMHAIVAALLVATLGLAAPPVLAFDPGGLPPVAHVLGTDVRSRDADQVRYVILLRLLDRYAAERGLAATPAEIDAYVERMRRAEADDRAQWQARLRDVDAQLAGPALPQAQRERLDGERRMLAALLASVPASPTRAAVEDATSKQAAAVAIRRWKASRDLHARYGGRVALTSSGPEPLDAHRRFLEEEQRKGTWKLVDQALAPAFWAHFGDAAGHRVMAAGSPEEAAALAPPW